MATRTQRGSGWRGTGRRETGPGPTTATIDGEPDLTALLTTPPEDPAWVDAGPFRAHVRHLMAVGALDLDEVAVVLGLPTRSVRHLLHGRAGRPVRRISPCTARRLLLVRADEVRHLRWSLTPADAARRARDRLVAAGWSLDELGGAVGFGAGDLDALDSGSHCNRLLAVRVVGLARRLPGTLDDEDLAAVASAA